MAATRAASYGVDFNNRPLATARTPKIGQGHILDMVSIREWPAEVEDRAVPGHWEGDLLTGANDTRIATLVERNTRVTMLVRIPRKDTTTVVDHACQAHPQAA